MSKRGDFFKLGGFCVTIGGALVWSAVKRIRTRRKVEDLSSLPIKSAPQGLVELSGFAWSEKSFLGVEGRHVAFMSLELEELVHRGKNRRWVKRYSAKSADSFILKDQSHSAVVVMANDLSNYHVKEKHFELSDLSLEVKKRFRDIFTGAKVAGFSLDGPSQGRFRFGIKELPLGCPVLIQGCLQTAAPYQKNVLWGVSDFLIKYKRLISDATYRSKMLDVDHNGLVDEEEYMAGFKIAAEMSRKKLVNDTSFGSEPVEFVDIEGVVLGTEHHKLIIADTHQEYFLKRMASWNLTQILGGAFLVALGACFIALEFTDYD